MRDVVSDLVVTPAPMMPDEVEALTSGDSLSTSCVADVLHESDILKARAEPTAHILASSNFLRQRHSKAPSTPSTLQGVVQPGTKACQG